jgi:two-component sensor histidine kinase
VRIKKALGKSQNRIKSMALVHEELYGSADLAKIDLLEYTRNLTGYLIKSYSIGNGIKIKLCLEELSLGIDRAIRFGLIATELPTNCLKSVLWAAFDYLDLFVGQPIKLVN